MVDSTKLTPREAEAFSKVKFYAAWSAGAGLLPLPFVDFAAITGLQVKLLADLSKLYGIPFTKSLAKTLIGSLIGSALPVTVGAAAGSSLKAVPVIGTAIGVIVQPALASASTYALGRVFIQHFESGGTFLDFDPVKTRAYFEEQFNEAHGEKPAAEAAPESKPTPPTAPVPPVVGKGGPAAAHA
jgi:uncharacterized protein (DUF697 family)